jgi:hypothetical protein
MGIALVLGAIALLAGMRVDVSRIPRWFPWVSLSLMWGFQLLRFSVL